MLNTLRIGVGLRNASCRPRLRSNLGHPRFELDTGTQLPQRDFVVVIDVAAPSIASPGRTATSEISKLKLRPSSGVPLNSDVSIVAPKPPCSISDNKLAGDAIRDLIAAREAPALIEQTFLTVGGVRRTDVLKLGDELLGIESKVGRTGLGPRERQELARDWWLVRQGQLARVRWEFSISEVTGKIGPTPVLAEKLKKLGFDVRINTP